MLKKIISLKKKISFLNKKTTHQVKPLVFIPPLEKPISKAQISSFWKSYFSGKLLQFVLNRTNKQKPTNISVYNSNVFVFPISKTSLVNVRIMNDLLTSTFFKSRYFYLKDVCPKLKLKRSKVVVSEILDIRKQNKKEHILERVFPSISIFDFDRIYERNIKKEDLSKVNRYAPSFINSLRKNDVSLTSFNKDLKKAYKELILNKQLAGYTDLLENNIIILGYDKTNGSFKFGLIDYYGAVSKSMKIPS